MEIKIKYLIFALLLFTNIAIAGTIDGVPMNCSEKAEQRMSKKTSFSMVSACRDRKNPVREHYTYCDGSSCTGFTATFADTACKLSDWWDGQDDQDAIDSDEWKTGCLTGEDFKKTEATNKIAITSGGELNGVKSSEIYKLAGEIKNLTSEEVAELIGKEIRKKYYKMRFDLVSKNLNEITLMQALKNLARAEGESSKFSRKEIESIETWNEGHLVSKAFVLSLELSHQGGTAIEQFTIFVPTEKYEPILTIGRSVYAE